MNTKEKKQSILVRILKAPIKFVEKATKFYTNSMFDCAGRIGENTVFNCGVAPQMYQQLPRNFSTVSRSSSKDDHKQEEELRELIRAVSTKFGEAKVEIIKPISVSAVEKRSCSVGIGRMGRIDEEMPCDFREYDAAAHAYPRCKSYAVTSRN